MPNHCEVDLYITGPTEDVKQLVEATKFEDEDGQGYRILHNLFPCPQELIDTDATLDADPNSQPELYHKQVDNKKKYGSKDWYDWCIKNWGSKWGDYQTEFMDVWEYSDEESRADYTFLSAWGPPTAGIVEISKKYPTLTFRMEYFEQGMGFEGKDEIKNGHLEEIFYSDEYMGHRGG